MSGSAAHTPPPPATHPARTEVTDPHAAALGHEWQPAHSRERPFIPQGDHLFPRRTVCSISSQLKRWPRRHPPCTAPALSKAAAADAASSAPHGRPSGRPRACHAGRVSGHSAAPRAPGFPGGSLAPVGRSPDNPRGVIRRPALSARRHAPMPVAVFGKVRARSRALHSRHRRKAGQAPAPGLHRVPHRSFTERRSGRNGIPSTCPGAPLVPLVMRPRHGHAPSRHAARESSSHCQTTPHS